MAAQNWVIVTSLFFFSTIIKLFVLLLLNQPNLLSTHPRSELGSYFFKKMKFIDVDVSIDKNYFPSFRKSVSCLKKEAGRLKGRVNNAISYPEWLHVRQVIKTNNLKQRKCYSYKSIYGSIQSFSFNKMSWIKILAHMRWLPVLLSLKPCSTPMNTCDIQLVLANHK